MPEHLARSLEEAIGDEFPQLSAVTERHASVKPEPGKWSPKEELGHLIDSATNNHVRFVGASIDEFRGPGYEQDAWVATHGYHEMQWAELIGFWKTYNLFLARLIRRIPEDRMARTCTIGDSRPVTLQFVIEDYILHMQHHIDHILRRETIRQYPGAAAGV